MATHSQKTYCVNQTNSMSYTEIQADFSRKFRLGGHADRSLALRREDLLRRGRAFGASGRDHPRQPLGVGGVRHRAQSPQQVGRPHQGGGGRRRRHRARHVPEDHAGRIRVALARESMGQPMEVFVPGVRDAGVVGCRNCCNNSGNSCHVPTNCCHRGWPIEMPLVDRAQHRACCAECRLCVYIYVCFATAETLSSVSRPKASSW